MPEHAALRVYLDANVLFSASRDPKSRFLDLWKLSNVVAVTSQYAVGEVSRNIESLDHRQRFENLLSRTYFVSDADVRLIPGEVDLIAKDKPILAAAIAASVDYLLTGDRRHFGALYNAAVAGVRVLAPGEFLKLHRDRLSG